MSALPWKNGDVENVIKEVTLMSNSVFMAKRVWWVTVLFAQKVFFFFYPRVQIGEKHVKKVPDAHNISI